MRKRRRILLPLGLLVAATLTLSGCGVSLVHEEWQRRISQSDAVLSAEWDYVNSWTTGGSRYTGEVHLDPSISEEQAREIVSSSCRENAIFDEVFYEARPEDLNVSVEKRGLKGTCGEGEELASFARILNVVDQQPPSFEADVLVWSYETRTDYATDEEMVDPATIWAETTTVTDLFAFATQLRQAVGVNDPFDFTGSVDDDASLITNFGREINIAVPAGFDLAPILPILAEAYLLDHEGISYSPDAGLVVAIDDTATLTGDEVAQVGELAEAAGVPFSPRLADTPFGSPGASETRQLFLRELEDLPAVEATAFEEHATVVATTASLEGVNEVLDYLDQNSGERLNTLNDSLNTGTDKVSILLKNSENEALTVRLDGGVSSLSDLRTVVASAIKTLNETPEIEQFHVQSWPDKLRVHVTLAEDTAATRVEATSQELRKLLQLATLDRIAVGRFNGATEYLSPEL